MFSFKRRLVEPWHFSKRNAQKWARRREIHFRKVILFCAVRLQDEKKKKKKQRRKTTGQVLIFITARANAVWNLRHAQTHTSWSWILLAENAPGGMQISGRATPDAFGQNRETTQTQIYLGTRSCFTHCAKREAASYTDEWKCIGFYSCKVVYYLARTKGTKPGVAIANFRASAWTYVTCNFKIPENGHERTATHRQ